MSETLDIIRNRSSIRKYKQEAVPEEWIHQLLQAGLQAPTARNTQEIHFSVVNGTHPILKELEEEKRNVLVSALTEQSEKDSILNNPNNFYFDAPVVIFLSADKNFGWSQVDAGIAVENISLAAEASGLGSLIIGSIKNAFVGEKKEYFEKALQFPDNHEFVIAVAAGYKATEKEPHTYDETALVSWIE